MAPPFLPPGKLPAALLEELLQQEPPADPAAARWPAPRRGRRGDRRRRAAAHRHVRPDYLCHGYHRVLRGPRQRQRHRQHGRHAALVPGHVAVARKGHHRGPGAGHLCAATGGMPSPPGHAGRRAYGDHPGTGPAARLRPDAWAKRRGRNWSPAPGRRSAMPSCSPRATRWRAAPS